MHSFLSSNVPTWKFLVTGQCCGVENHGHENVRCRLEDFLSEFVAEMDRR